MNSPATDAVEASVGRPSGGGVLEWIAVRPFKVHAGLLSIPFTVWVIAYFGRYGLSAFQPTDYEYVPSQVWRIIHGEVPYRDFIYHKPPGTLLFHTVWFLLPDGWQVKASRLFFYAQMACAGLLPALWAVWRRTTAFGLRLPLLTLTTTVVALHNFPVMPWQTTDGIFFCVLGLVAWAESCWPSARRPLLWRGAASGLLAFGVACKQSYILVCVGFGCFCACEEAWTAWRSLRSGQSVKPALLRLAASAGPAVAVIGGIFLWLWGTGAWTPFIAQFRSQSNADALWAYIVGPYKYPFTFTALIWMPLGLLGSLDSADRRTAIAVRLVAWVWVATLYLWILIWILMLWGDAPRRLGFLLFAALLGTFIGRCVRLALQWPESPEERFAALTMAGLHAGFVLIALGAQLSLGYPSSILGIFGLGLVLHELLPRERRLALDVAPAAAVLAIALYFSVRLNDERPYRDMARPLPMDLGAVFPKLAGIRAGSPNFHRYQALKQILDERASGRPFAVLQDYPGAHWLTNTLNPIGIDWAFPPEPDGFEDRLIRELEATDLVAIVPKEKDAHWTTEGVYPPCEQVNFGAHNALSRHVADRWKLVGQNNYFCAFARR